MMTHKIAQHYEKVKKHHPGFLEAVENLGLAAKKAGPIDEKNAQLIQLAASVAIRSEGATHSHTKRALETGATEEEIRHCVIMLTNTIGFPAVMAGLSWVNDILG
ncbi:MAG: carboxymuconolactone decarboxylase family protein [Bacteroidetes bacterium]|nr:MAG: carboxymuconolactone decarboxylase family protein [Bacteroidota bacterium]